MTQKEIALKYAEAGIKVFPACPKTKKPLTQNGFKDATDNETKIKNWFSRNPDAFIASPCDGQFTVVDCDLKKPQAFESLGKIFPYVNQTQTRVTTASNGSHYYFKADEELTRKINFIPDIDLLGVGGYAVLPDDNTYKQNGSLESFIESLNSLPDLDEELKKHITKECEIESLSEYRSNYKKTVTPSENSVAKSESQAQDDEEAKIVEENERILSHKTYETSSNRTNKTIDFDGSPLQFEQGSIDTDTVNALFYNKKIQTRLANFLGVLTPEKGNSQSRAFTSKLPTHADNNPSMGSRWAESSKGQHLVIRDFSDHYGDGFVDYNLVRLYATKFKGKTRYMNSPEFYVWFMRLLDESGVIEIEKPEMNIDTEGLTKSEITVGRGFLDLLAYKLLYKDGNDDTAYANKFAASWCGVSSSLISRAKGKLIRYGLMEKTGTHGEGFFACSVFKLGSGVIDKREITKYDINKTVKQDLSVKEKARKSRSRILSAKRNKQTVTSMSKDEASDDNLNKETNETCDNEESYFDQTLKDPEVITPTGRLSAEDELTQAQIKQERLERFKERMRLKRQDNGG